MDQEQFKFINLGSSSSGNCYYLELPRNKQANVKILIEAGFSYKEILKKSLLNGIDINDVDAALITHSHMDHCKSAKELIDRGIQLYANKDIISKYDGDIENILIPGETKYIAPDTKVLPFEVEHDAPNSLGFVISTNNIVILFVNDSKFFKADLSQISFNFIFIEANYDGQFIHFAYENAKNDNNRQDIARYERLFNSHMSLANCKKHLAKLNLSQCTAIFLMHLSDRHANENKFKYEVKTSTGINCYVCKKNGGIL